MKILLTIAFCLALTVGFAQKQKLFIKGTKGDLYINHKVGLKETYASIASKYGLSPAQLAYYNNLDYHKGKLLAKFLKVPLNNSNFVSAAPVQGSYAIAVFKKNTGPAEIAGYIVAGADRLSKAPVKSTSLNDSSKANETIAATPDTSLATNAAPAIAQKVATQQPKKAPATWIKRSKQRHPQVNHGPGRFIKEFFSSAIVNTMAAFVIIAIIYFYASIKKQRFTTKRKLRKDIVKLISGAILNNENGNEPSQLVADMPPLLKGQFQQKEVCQLLIDEIITAKRSFRGQGATNLNNLYQQLNLLPYSVAKLNNRRWYVKAKGIQELASMDQSDYLFRIYRLTNSRNEYVRMEAQSAIVHFAGFKGLRFLKVLTYPISNWQQIKLIEQLRFLQANELPDAKKLLQSQNNSVVIFTIKIISVFHHLDLHDAVLGCMHYPDAEVRYHAVNCLQYIYNATTAKSLEKFYDDEVLRNQLAILQAVKQIGSEEQTDFLYLKLFDKNDAVKMAAADALIICCPHALELLKSVSKEKGYPYTQIFNQLKENVVA